MLPICRVSDTHGENSPEMRGLTNCRMYGSKRCICRKASTVNTGYGGISKTGCYESPYTVTGGIKGTGSETEPKSIK